MVHHDMDNCEALQWPSIGQHSKKVFLNVNNFTSAEGLTPQFMSKFVGPFLVVKQVLKDV